MNQEESGKPVDMLVLAAIFGSIVGISLGLTGGGGALLAMPLLVYGLGRPAHESVAVALTATAIIAGTGAVQRWYKGDVDVRAGLVFAVSGMVFAPAGARLGGLMDPTWLLLAFGALMAVVALLMWRTAGRYNADIPLDAPPPRTACHSGDTGGLRLTSRCTAVLMTAGALTGILSGLFGVGGGFLIVPALLLVSGMALHRAVATSLMVIALIGASGVAAFIWQGRLGTPWLPVLFTGGGLLGLWAATRLASRMPQPVMQRIFAAALVGVAVLMIGNSMSTL